MNMIFSVEHDIRHPRQTVTTNGDFIPNDFLSVQKFDKFLTHFAKISEHWNSYYEIDWFWPGWPEIAHTKLWFVDLECVSLVDVVCVLLLKCGSLALNVAKCANVSYNPFEPFVPVNRSFGQS